MEEFRDCDISSAPFDVINDIQTEELLEFFAFCKTVLGNSNAAIQQKRSAIKGFYYFFTKIQKRIAADPTEMLEIPQKEKPLPKYLRIDECRQLLLSARQTAVSDFLKRDYCMLTFFLNCGMRVSELVGINMKDIREDSLKLLGKGRKERVIFLNQACMDALAEYLAERNTIPRVKEEPALFISRRTGKRITVRRVEQIVEAELRAAGLGNMGYTPHKLRHTAATLIYDHGNTDVLVLKQILGHESVQTTEIYTHLSQNDVREAMRQNKTLEDLE